MRSVRCFPPAEASGKVLPQPRRFSAIWLLCLFFLAAATPVQGFQSKPYRGAEYRTIASYTYGKFEVRMQSVAANGMLSTFFTYHDPPRWSRDKWNEIDLEILGRYDNEVQFNTITPGEVSHVLRQQVPFNPHKGFHVYGIEWTPDYVSWLVDGLEVYRQTESHIETLRSEQKIMMNIWQPIWTDWVGSFDDAVLPLHALYDWVRYSSYTPGDSSNFTLQWHDDLDSFDSSRWQKATHTFDSNNAQFVQDNIAFQDGYMALSLTKPGQTGYNGGAITETDVDAPWLKYARRLGQVIRLTFSEPLEQSSAETVANYIVPGKSVASATLSPSALQVDLAFSDSLRAIEDYSLIVRRLRDTAAAANEMPLTTSPVRHAVTLPAVFNVGDTADTIHRPVSSWHGESEYGYVGGAIQKIDATVDIQGTEDDALYRSAISGISFFRVRVPDGNYSLILHFAESAGTGEGERIFDIVHRGQVLASEIEIVKEAGPRIAYTISLSNIEVKDGILDLHFRAITGQPLLSGVSLMQMATTGVREPSAQALKGGKLVFPNPARDQARLRLTLAESAEIKATLFDLLGRQVRDVFEGKLQAGHHDIAIKIDRLPAGTYFLRVVQGDFLPDLIKMILVK